jgi:hypothetical protein
MNSAFCYINVCGASLYARIMVRDDFRAFSIQSENTAD